MVISVGVLSITLDQKEYEYIQLYVLHKSAIQFLVKDETKLVLNLN